MVTHEVSYGPFTKTTYELSPDRLSVRTKGGIGGASAEIPVASIVGFYALSHQLRGAHAALGTQMMAMSQAGGQLTVAWTENAKTRTKTFTLNTDAPTFTPLLMELVRLRPEASLLSLTQEEAHKKLGLWTMDQKVKVSVAGFIGLMLVFCGVIMAIQPDPQHAPSSTRARPHATSTPQR